MIDLLPQPGAANAALVARFGPATSLGDWKVMSQRNNPSAATQQGDVSRKPAHVGIPLLTPCRLASLIVPAGFCGAVLWIGHTDQGEAQGLQVPARRHILGLHPKRPLMHARRD